MTSDLAALRDRLRDRQKKEGALGTAETSLCLDLELITELEDLQAQRDTPAPAQPSGKPRLGSGAAQVDSSELDAAIEAKQAEIRAASIRVVFRALSSSKYQEILNTHGDIAKADSADAAAFFNALAAACLYQIWENGEPIQIEAKDKASTWAALVEGTSYGEWDKATSEAYVLNRRTVDVPFSLKP